MFITPNGPMLGVQRENMGPDSVGSAGQVISATPSGLRDDIVSQWRALHAFGLALQPMFGTMARRDYRPGLACRCSNRERCPRIGKHPLVDFASKDPGQIDAWIVGYGHLNVWPAINLEASHIAALIVDHEAGTQTLREIEAKAGKLNAPRSEDHGRSVFFVTKDGIESIKGEKIAPGISLVDNGLFVGPKAEAGPPASIDSQAAVPQWLGLNAGRVIEALPEKFRAELAKIRAKARQALEREAAEAAERAKDVWPAMQPYPPHARKVRYAISVSHNGQLVKLATGNIVTEPSLIAAIERSDGEVLVPLGDRLDPKGVRPGELRFNKPFFATLPHYGTVEFEAGQVVEKADTQFVDTVRGLGADVEFAVPA